MNDMILEKEREKNQCEDFLVTWKDERMQCSAKIYFVKKFE